VEAASILQSCQHQAERVSSKLHLVCGRFWLLHNFDRTDPENPGAWINRPFQVGAPRNISGKAKHQTIRSTQNPRSW
jgi:hypothetical protein